MKDFFSKIPGVYPYLAFLIGSLWLGFCAPVPDKVEKGIQSVFNPKTGKTYTITFTSGNSTMITETISGADLVSITDEKGKVVFPCPKDTVIAPPVDTGSTNLLVGVNTNHWQPKEKQTRFNGVRYYFPLGWGFTSSGWYGQPLKQAQKQFLGVDDYLVYMKSKGTDVLFCPMQSPDWLNGQSNGTGSNDFPPIKPGLNRTDPKSYSTAASLYKTLAIRYGSKVWPYGSYKIDPAPPRWTGDERQSFKSGLNLVKYIEVGNEPDRWWKIGTPEYMTPQEYGAFLFAAYDSIKAADPNLVVVMAGLTNFDLAYLKGIKSFADGLGRKFPADVVNLHHYSSAGNLPGVHPPTWPTNQAVAPESDKDFGTVAQIVTWAKTIGLPTWVTEFGYDTEPGSQMYPILYAGLSSEQIQAQFLSRSILEYIRFGVTRTYLFTIADEPNTAAGTFASSGLLKGEAKGYEEKPSFGVVVGLSESLKGFRYVADQSTTKTRIMKFSNGSKTLFYYWSPTSTGAKYNDVVGGKTVSVTEFVQFTVNQ